jgi:hypothetical protein
MKLDLAAGVDVQIALGLTHTISLAGHRKGEQRDKESQERGKNV